MSDVLSEGLTLFTAGLFSKWGFSDGDCPDRVYDWCEDHEEAIEDTSWSMDGVEVDDRADNDYLVAQLPVASVDVPRDVVVATIRRHIASGEAPC